MATIWIVEAGGRHASSPHGWTSRDRVAKSLLMTANRQHAVLDVVALLAESGRWPAGTLGTVVETDDERVLVEIDDDRGHGLDLISLPHAAVAPSHADSSRAVS